VFLRNFRSASVRAGLSGYLLGDPPGEQLQQAKERASDFRRRRRFRRRFSDVPFLIVHGYSSVTMTNSFWDVHQETQRAFAR
jgi:hypothetical protein